MFKLFFLQKSSLFIYKSWFFTISFYIFQHIHFAGILIKHQIFFVKKYNFFQKSCLFLYESLISTISLNIYQDIHFFSLSFVYLSFLTWWVFLHIRIRMGNRECGKKSINYLSSGGGGGGSCMKNMLGKIFFFINKRRRSVFFCCGG